MKPLTPPETLKTPIPVRVAAQREEAETAVAREIADLVRERARAGRRTVLGLATGGTMRGVYAELVRLHRDDGLDCSSVVGFNLDEYVGVAAEDPLSFQSYMEEVLYRHVNVPRDAIHVPDGELARLDARAYCRSFEEDVRAAGGIDLQLLGIGRNGHVGFNEPGSPAGSRTRVVALDAVTRRDAEPYFGGAPVPTHAVTVGVATILEARRLRVLAFGEHKGPAVRAALFGPETAAVPASFLRRHADVTLWLDAAAARAAGADGG